MNEYILFMHSDAKDTRAADDGEKWAKYITILRNSGQFDGGSSIGIGECVRKNELNRPASTDLTGFVRVRAASLEDAKRLLAGNPVYEAGGTVEVRELPPE